MEHEEIISDHRPLLIKLKHKNITKRAEIGKEKMINKKWLRQTTLEMMQEIVDTRDCKGINGAFAGRLKKK